jgi:hypothetical protein
VINVKYMDKRGTFLGNMWMAGSGKARLGENLAQVLLRKGYGNIQDHNADKLGKI